MFRSQIKKIDPDYEDDEFIDDIENPSYNVTKKDKHLSAAAILAIKLQQEKKLYAKLHPHFSKLSKDVKQHYASNGKLPSFEPHKKGVKKVIKDHYVDTATKFSINIRDNFKPLIDEHHEALQGLIDSRIDKDSEERAEFSSDSIASTTKDNFTGYIKDAIVAAAIAGVVLSDREVANEISDRFDDTIDDRLDLISITETNNAAGDGQQDELDAMNDIDAEFEDGTTFSDYKQQKTWVAILDDRTREWHADADGQTVDDDEPFEVNGEQLMEPGDDSLGASPENLINCRCVSITSFEYES